MKQVYWKQIKIMLDDLRANDHVIMKHTKTPLPLNKREKEIIEKHSPHKIFDFHSELNGFELNWMGKGVKDADVKGATKILPVQEIVKDWKGIVYFDFTPTDDRIRNFHPIDFFVDEACVGAFLNEANSEDESMYLYSFEGEPVSLSLDMNAYIQMMSVSRGFLYWQYALIEILDGKENPVSQRFKEWMPKLFADFNWEKYVELYSQQKLFS